MGLIKKFTIKKKQIVQLLRMQILRVRQRKKRRLRLLTLQQRKLRLLTLLRIQHLRLLRKQLSQRKEKQRHVVTQPLIKKERKEIRKVLKEIMLWGIH